MSEKNDYIIEMHGIQKSFGGVKALRNIDLQVKRGSCHALLGENGAGKSTLMKVLTGIIAKDSGKILLNGEEVQIQSLRHVVGDEDEGLVQLLLEALHLLLQGAAGHGGQGAEGLIHQDERS